MEISDVVGLLKRINSISTANRSKIARLEWESSAPNTDVVAGFTLGPSGFLRAPTVIVGGRMLVGFSEELYGELAP